MCCLQSCQIMYKDSIVFRIGDSGISLEQRLKDLKDTVSGGNIIPRDMGMKIARRSEALAPGRGHEEYRTDEAVPPEMYSFMYFEAGFSCCH